MSYVLSEVNCIFWKKCRGKRPDALYKRIVSDLYTTVWKKIIWGGECWLTCPSDMVFCGIYICIFFFARTRTDSGWWHPCCSLLCDLTNRCKTTFSTRSGQLWFCVKKWQVLKRYKDGDSPASAVYLSRMYVYTRCCKE